MSFPFSTSPRFPSPSVCSILARAADAVPLNTALVIDDRRVTFGELNESARRLASALRSFGTTAGDRVLIASGDGFESVVAMLAAWRAGAEVIVPNHLKTADRFADVCAQRQITAAFVTGTDWRAWRDTGFTPDDQTLRHIVVSDSDRPEPIANGPVLSRFYDHLAEPPADETETAVKRVIDTDAALTVLSGGEWVTHTHRSLRAAAESYAIEQRLGADDVLLNLFPLGMIESAVQNLAVWGCGGAVVLDRAVTKPARLRDRFVRERISVAVLPPVAFAALLDTDPDAGSLRSLRRFGVAEPRLPVGGLPTIAGVESEGARFFSDAVAPFAMITESVDGGSPSDLRASHNLRATLTNGVLTLTGSGVVGDVCRIDPNTIALAEGESLPQASVSLSSNLPN